MGKFLTICMSFLTLALFGQQLPGPVINYDVENGLSENNVTAIAEDSLGFIWVGTREGLNRFDGVRFKSYFEGQGKLASNRISALCQVPGQGLLVGHFKQGVQLFDPCKEEFMSVPFALAADGEELSAVRAIEMESDSTVLVGYFNGVYSRGGLTRLNLRTLEQEVLFEEFTTGVWSIEADRERGVIWAGADSLYRMERADEAQEWKPVLIPIPRTKNRPYFRSLAIRGDDLHVGTSGEGLVVLDAASGQLLRHVEYRDRPDKRLVYNRTMSVLPEANSERVWLGTLDKGLVLIDSHEKPFFFPSDKRSMFTVASKVINVLFCDHRGMLWIGGDKGLSKIDQSRPIVKSQFFPEMEETGPSSQILGRVHEFGDDLFLMMYRRLTNYIYSQEKQGIVKEVSVHGENRFGAYYYSDHRGVSDGEHLFVMGAQELMVMEPPLYEPRTLINVREHVDEDARGQYLRTIDLSLDGLIWWGSGDNAVGWYDMDRDSLMVAWLIGEGPLRWSQAVGREPSYSDANGVISLDTDGKGGAWVSSVRGVFHVDKDGFVRELSELLGPGEEFNANILGNIQLYQETLLLGTGGQGLYIIDLKKKEVRHFNRQNGLPHQYIYDMVVDDSGRLWAITGNGVFSLDVENPEEVLVLKEEDGLADNDFTYHSISKLSNGRLLVGYEAGFGIFHADSMRAQPLPEKLVLTDVLVNNERRPVEDMVLDIEYGDALTLNFTALGFVKPSDYRYAWKMTDQETWKPLEQPNVYLPSVREGDFKIYVKAGNASGEWIEEFIVLDTRVKVPFWLTTSFTIAVVVFLLFLIYMGYQIRLRRIRKSERLRTAYNQRISELEMKALRAQMNPHFLFNSLNSIKYFIIRNQTEEASDYLTKFGRLIRMILSNSNSETITLAAELEALRLYVELESIRFDGKFACHLSIAPNVEAEEITLPPLVIQPFVENAIWHGLMHKDEPGDLWVRVYREDNHLICEIEDNGIGREKAIALRSKSATKSKSMGMDITRNRLMKLQAESSSGKEFEEIEVVDLFDEQGQANGTLVMLRIQLQAS